MTRRVAHAAQIGALVLALALVPAAVAAKGGSGGGKPSGGSGSSSLSLADPLVHDANGNGLPNHGDVVTFTVSTTATTQPFVNRGATRTAPWSSTPGTATSMELSTTAGTSGSLRARGRVEPPTARPYLDKATNRGWTQLASTSFRVDA